MKTMRRSATLAVLAAAAAAAPALAQLATPRPSPNATVSQVVGVTKIEVVYSRPHVKGPTRKEERVIWGELVPWDKVWRTGANAVTKITFDGDVMVEGQKLAAGSYGLYTIPGKTEWTVIFNKVTTGEPFDYAAVLALEWEKLMVPVSLTDDTKAQFLANAKDAVAKAKADDWQTPLTAARYLYDNKYALDDAARWLDKSIATKATFGNLSTKANALAAEGKTKEAIATAEKALATGAAAEQKPSSEAVAALEKKIAEWKK